MEVKIVPQTSVPYIFAKCNAYVLQTDGQLYAIV